MGRSEGSSKDIYKYFNFFRMLRKNAFLIFNNFNKVSFVLK